MSDYEHDIFISYRRLGDAQKWVERHLIPVLKNALAPELGRNPDIFFDARLEAGGTWPVDLGSKLAKSRILLCLWSKTFLQSEWCTKELSIMWKREQQLQLRTPARPKGTVAVYPIHDGETIPPELKICQELAFIEFYNPMMREDSPKREEFFGFVQLHASSLADLILHAPPYQEEWEQLVAEDFYKLFFTQIARRQASPPRYTP